MLNAIPATGWMITKNSRTNYGQPTKNLTKIVPLGLLYNTVDQEIFIVKKFSSTNFPDEN